MNQPTLVQPYPALNLLDQAADYLSIFCFAWMMATWSHGEFGSLDRVIAAIGALVALYEAIRLKVRYRAS